MTYSVSKTKTTLYFLKMSKCHKIFMHILTRLIFMSNVCTETKMAFSMVLSIINKICTPQTMNAILANQSAINYSINTRHMTSNGLISLTRLLHHLCINICAFTPNCNKVVIEKSKKPNSSVWSRAMISDRFFLFGVRQFLPSTARVQFFSFFYRKPLDDGRLNRVNFNSHP